MRAHFAKAAEVAAAISDAFARPIELEFEKCYSPFLLYSKKRYAGQMFSSSPDAPDYVDVKGLQLVRRDSAPVARAASHAVLDALMRDQDAAKALRIAREHVLAVLDAPTGCDMTPFVMSKTLRGTYKNDTQPHVVVARAIQRRSGEMLPSGSRVPYVYVRRTDDALLGAQSGCAEDPTHARDAGMDVDKLYYVRNQLQKPLVSLLEVLDANVERTLFDDDEEISTKLRELESGKKDAVKEAKRTKFVRDNRLQEITRFFTKATKKTDPEMP